MSTVSSVDTATVLEAFLTVVPDKLAEGKIMEPGESGTFRVSVSSEGAELDCNEFILYRRKFFGYA